MVQDPQLQSSTHDKYRHRHVVLILHPTLCEVAYHPQQRRTPPGLPCPFCFIYFHLNVLEKLLYTNEFIFSRFFFFSYIKKEKTTTVRKQRPASPGFLYKTWKAKSERQSSEYLCVYTHSSFRANICLQTLTHSCLAADSWVRILAYLASFIAPVWK